MRAPWERKWWAVLVAASTCYACAPRPTPFPSPSKETRVLVGRVEKMRRDWWYEPPCGLIQRLQGKCVEFDAYDAVIAAEPVMVFRLPRGQGGGPHPQVGDSGAWTVHREVIYPYLRCAQYAAMTAACPPETVWALESDDDMPEAYREPRN